MRVGLSELDLIDHGLEEMGEAVENGEPVLVVRCAFNHFGQLQKALEDRGIAPLSSQSEYIAQTPRTLPEAEATEILKMIDALELDDDVQRVFRRPPLSATANPAYDLINIGSGPGGEKGAAPSALSKNVPDGI